MSGIVNPGVTDRMLRGPRSICKICHTSIYDADATVWVCVNGLPGLAHHPCAEPATNANNATGEQDG